MISDMWFFSQKQTKPVLKRIQLDFASTTPVHSEVYKAMQPYFCDEWANPSAIYKEGVHAREVVESSRTELARTLRVRPSDVTFTSGGTESNNLALIGVIDALENSGRSCTDMEIVTTRIEHPSVLETVQYLEKRGIAVRYVSVDKEGLIDMHHFESVLNEKTVLCTFAYVNSEIGVVQDIKKITRIIRVWNEKHTAHIFIHTDASQAPLWLPCALDALGVDMMTLDAGKCYGPKGVGVLVHRQHVPIQSIVYGGGQESGLRSGTENTALIVGCVRALVRAQEGYVSRSKAVALLRDTLFTLLLDTIPRVTINGSHTSRVANNVNISIPEIDTEYAVITLDAKGVAVSTKSACGAQKQSGSYVVREVTHDDDRAQRTLRLTLGEETTRDELECVVSILKEHVMFMRNASVNTHTEQKTTKQKFQRA